MLLNIRIGNGPPLVMKTNALVVHTLVLPAAVASPFAPYVLQGVVANKKKAKHYWELAAMNGSLSARCNLGLLEEGAGNHQRALKHFIISAWVGDNESLDKVKQGFRSGFVTKDEYAGTLRAYHESQTEMKSEARDKAAAVAEEYRAQR